MKKLNESGFSSVEMIFTLSMVALVIGVLWLKIWIVGSAIASGVKAMSHDCGKTYGIEGALVSGDWFCTRDN